MQRNSLLLILSFFLLYTLIQLVSGILLFVLKIGIRPESIVEFYLGSGFTRAKTFMGILEISVPHLLAIGLLVLVVSHFLSFLNPLKLPYKRIFIFIIFLLALLNITSGILIRFISPFFAYIKLTAFFFFGLSLSSLFFILILTFKKFYEQIEP